VQVLVVGTSAEGRPIQAFVLGPGSHDLLVVGDIHGAPEVNTAALVWAMLQTFEREPALLPADLQLVLIPEANPDGLAEGTRELADGVDPNRNWPTPDWSPDSYGPDGYLPDGGGPVPLSEPETQALAAFVLRLRPVAVLSYHSAAPLVMGGPVARASGLFDAYAEASGYPSGYWTAYPVSGDFAQWCDDSLGIPTVEVELSDHVHPELERNLAGSLAVMQRITRNPPYLGRGEHAGPSPPTAPGRPLL
jgi:protein MpaA